MNSGFMDIALEEARLAAGRGEVPVGAVLVRNGEVLAQAGNRTRELNDPTAHAEVLVIREACAALQSERLPDCDLYVTLEPCTLCATTISFARIRRLYLVRKTRKVEASQTACGFSSRQPAIMHRKSTPTLPV